MSGQTYWLSVLYVIAAVVMACNSYNFMHRRAAQYEIEVSFLIKMQFLCWALVYGITWPVWLAISLINYIRKGNHGTSS